MATQTTFGEEVIAEAQRLRDAGLDANQIAGILCKNDPTGKNYGIGILLGGDGKPMPTSATLLEYLQKELQDSDKGSYLNSDTLKKDITEAVLRWQGVPQEYWANFQLLLPSDAGTGAVQTAVQAATILKDGLQTLAVEELGWPAYKAIATSSRLKFQEYNTDGVASGDNVLPLYQAGPMNTTGRVPSLDIVQARAKAASANGDFVVLDRAYSGFEYARKLASSTYEGIMQESFRIQVEPFIKDGVPFALAVSPTKAFVTFSLRPCGLLLIYTPNAEKAAEISPKLAGLIRARGSSFEHPVTRAFVKAMVRDRAKLEAEHAVVLERCAAAERQWQASTAGTPMAAQFTDQYAGLFRNPKAKQDAAREIYGAHLYPVLAQGRCRLNVTGLPSDETEAKQHIATFAEYCL